jgi:hypothetical protein
MASKDQKEVKKWRIASLTYNVNNRRSNRKEIQVSLCTVHLPKLTLLFQTWLENENLDPSANVLVSIALQLSLIACTKYEYLQFGFREVSYLDIGRETWNEILNEEMNNRGFTAISTSYLASNLMLIYSPWRVLNIVCKALRSFKMKWISLRFQKLINGGLGIRHLDYLATREQFQFK